MKKSELIKRLLDISQHAYQEGRLHELDDADLLTFEDTDIYKIIMDELNKD